MSQIALALFMLAVFAYAIRRLVVVNWPKAGKLSRKAAAE